MIERKSIAKWGFGMAPISRRMQRRYDTAVQTALDFFAGNIEPHEVSLDDLSELKGMFNRCVKQDQWDWFSVYAEFGQPPIFQMRKIVKNLKLLRRSILDDDTVAIESIKTELINNNLLTHFEAYQSGLQSHEQSPNAGWIYILSTREQPNILKIGMTCRSVVQRVKEINSATGVLIPFAARGVFRVKHAADAEKTIFEILSSYRIRPDREFFEMPFYEAVKTIETYLSESRMRERKRGRVIWFDLSKGYGFISQPDSEDIFLHSSQVGRSELSLLQADCEVEYDLGVRLQGLCALEVRLIETAC